MVQPLAHRSFGLLRMYAMIVVVADSDSGFIREPLVFYFEMTINCQALIPATRYGRGLALAAFAELAILVVM